jgi:hypothetical protein
MDDGLDGLRARYPGWSIQADWVPRPSASDYRRLRAQREGVTVMAFDTDTLAARILEAEGVAS